MIKFTNLSVTLQGHRIISNLTGSFPTTGFYGVLGPSGIGKTTFFKALLGLLPHQGFLSIHGHKIADFNRAQMADFRRRHVGFISQTPGLIERFTVEENLLMAARVKGFFTSQESRYEIARVLRLVAAEALRKKPVEQLSGGQSQLIALARALIGSPTILIADEPFSHLDAATEKNLLDLLKKLSIQRLILMSTHQTKLLEMYLDGAFKFGEGIRHFSGNLERAVPRIALGKAQSFPHALLEKLLATIDAKDRTSSKWLEFFMVAVFMLIAALSMVNSIVQTEWIQAMEQRMGNHLATVLPRKDMSRTFLAVDSIEAFALTEKYQAWIHDIGAIVDYDFSSLNQMNQWEVRWNQRSYFLPQLTIESINRTLMPNEIPSNLEIPPLDLNEVVLGMTQHQVYVLQRFFGTEHLASFFQIETPQIIVHLDNPSWDYDDQIALDWVGFYLSETPTVVHTSPMFALNFFEKRMQFSMTDVLDRRSLSPWTMTPIYFVRTDDVQPWLTAMRASASDRRIHVERYGFRHNPQHCPVEDHCSIERWLLFTQTDSSYDPYHYLSLNRQQAYLPLNSGALVRYEEALAFGFSKKFYLSFSEPLIDQVRDIEYKIASERLHQSLSIQGLYSGFYLDATSSKITFLPSKNQREGWKFSSAFFPNASPRPTSFWVLVNHVSQSLSDGFSLQYFMKASLPIDGWFDDDQLSISVDATSFENALFYQLQWPRFSLVPEGFLIDMTTYEANESSDWELHDSQRKIREDVTAISLALSLGLQAMIALASLPLFFVLLHLFYFKTKRLRTALYPFIILGLGPRGIDNIFSAHIATFLGRLAFPLLGGLIATTWVIEQMMGEYFKVSVRYVPIFEGALIVAMIALFSFFIFGVLRQHIGREKI